MNKPGNGLRKRAIDWDEVHRRMDRAQRTIERGASPTPEESRKILKARAKLLACEPVRQATPSEYVGLVAFALGYETYGIETSYVREICPLRELTPLPCTPSFVLGLINIRGQILSVIDIKKFFELPEKGLTDLNKVIMVHDENMEFGILADAILGTRSIPMEDILPPPSTFTGIRTDYLKGVTAEPIIVLDIARMLSDKRIIVHEEIAT
jgi:purine-binding chemotaxis protein CheW